MSKMFFIIFLVFLMGVALGYSLQKQFYINDQTKILIDDGFGNTKYITVEQLADYIKKN